MVPGMPLIDSGQEYDMNKRLLFFEKDTIIKTKGIMWPLLKSLAQLKREHRALDGGKDAASYHRIVTTNDEAILMFTRNKQGDAVTFLANMTDKEVTFTCEKEGVSKDFYSKEKIDFRKDLSIQLRPWEFRVLID